MSEKGEKFYMAKVPPGVWAMGPLTFSEKVFFTPEELEKKLVDLQERGYSITVLEVIDLI